MTIGNIVVFIAKEIATAKLQGVAFADDIANRIVLRLNVELYSNAIEDEYWGQLTARQQWHLIKSTQI